MKMIIVRNLGKARIESPLRLNHTNGDTIPNFTTDKSRILNNRETATPSGDKDYLFEKAGPRDRIFFKPSETRAAIVTCGGLCPGLNNVIRSLVLELHHNYGVTDIHGIRYGYQGMGEQAAMPLLYLTPDTVDAIDRQGGSLLGCSRGSPDVRVMANFLVRNKIDILFTIGGDGTQRGALELSRELRSRGEKISIIGIPKTVDNDVMFVDRTFGVGTAIDRARDVLDAAHTEAKSYMNGIAIVKLMGRDSGFLSAGATLASQQVNFTLIPELPFRLEGFLTALKKRILARHHALVVVAEGAGQDLVGGKRGKDASGNLRYNDIGAFLKEKVGAYFLVENIPINMKYIDPGYYIRSVAACTDDCILCDLYARHAAHAAMSGRTEMMVGFRGSFIHVPMEMATSARQKISLDGDIWRSVLFATGQPASFC